MEHYVTLFDSGYIPQGIALNASLARHDPDYTLWVLCIDEETHRLLTALSLPRVRLINLEDVETNELMRVKPERSRAEYCWTLTPFAPRFVFNTDSSVERVTYIDADIWFLKSPRPIFEEFLSSGKGVLITEHAYAQEYDQQSASGRFCVQFVTFDRAKGESVRQWWEDRCIEWCFNRFENGKFGDQKYLDSWPDLFGSLVHIMQVRGWAMAPWNSSRFAADQAIFFHFHGLRIVHERLAFLGWNYLTPKKILDVVYRPYFRDLRTAFSTTRALGHRTQSQRSISKHMHRRLRFRYVLWPFLATNVRKEISRFVRIC